MSAHTSLTPVRATERIEALDLLRGFAVLGILVMNILSYGMPGSAYFFPTGFGDMGGVNGLVWWIGDLLFESKFITIFSMLFGRVPRIGQAGLVVLIWVIELAWSPWWLARYRFGPAEWAWRSLSYRSLQPFRKRE